MSDERSTCQSTVETVRQFRRSRLGIPAGTG
jgi:hypothetical protein